MFGRLDVPMVDITYYNSDHLSNSEPTHFLKQEITPLQADNIFE